MNFSIVVGNPPYQEDDDGFGASAIPIYHKFIKRFFKCSDKTILITPSRWFVGGKGLDDFREWMLNRNDIVSIHHYDNDESPFETVSLPGGVNWFYRDKNYSGNPELNGKKLETGRFDILVKDPDVYPLIQKIKSESDRFLSDLYITNSYYGVQTNDERLKDEPENGDIKCFVSDEKGLVKWINSGHLTGKKKPWKVITSESYGEYPRFGPKHISPPDTIFSQSYIGFQVSSRKTAENLITYLQTGFANFFLSLRKNTQHISKKTVKWIPLPDLDREWREEDLYSYYGLNQEDINIIKNLSKNG